MVQKVPPPPTLPQQFQQLNRWLLELQGILNSQGTIDPSQVDGLPALFTQVATNTTDIATNTADIATNTTNIAANTAAIATNTADIATNTANIAALTARNQIRNGNGVPAAGLGSNGDLYINDTGGVGTYLYGKIGGTWIAFA
jgi:hypothetical protein